MNHPLIPGRYFAASNSCKGFCNYYGEVFTETGPRRLYIIKGGPGTGKSHFMKTVARHARSRGYTVTEYACSSDPSSLDGILLQKEGSPALGFLDGTAPHQRDPVLPGARDEIINLGSFWDASRLGGQEERIRTLGEEKAAAYRRAYAYLAAAGEVDNGMESRIRTCVRMDRLKGLARRILRDQPRGEGFAPVPALRRAVSMAGDVCLHTLEEASAACGGMLLSVEDYYGLGFCLTRQLWELSREMGHALLVSYDPVYPHKIDGLFYPDTGLCILVGNVAPVEGGRSRVLSLRRYAYAEEMRRLRPLLRRDRAWQEHLTEAALGELSSAASFHFELEGIYSAAMDFGAKEAYTRVFCEKMGL